MRAAARGPAWQLTDGRWVRASACAPSEASTLKPAGARDTASAQAGAATQGEAGMGSGDSMPAAAAQRAAPRPGVKGPGGKGFWGTLQPRRAAEAAPRGSSSATLPSQSAGAQLAGAVAGSASAALGSASAALGSAPGAPGTFKLAGSKPGVADSQGGSGGPGLSGSRQQQFVLDKEAAPAAWAATERAAMADAAREGRALARSQARASAQIRTVDMQCQMSGLECSLPLSRVA